MWLSIWEFEDWNYGDRPQPSAWAASPPRVRLQGCVWSLAPLWNAAVAIALEKQRQAQAPHRSTHVLSAPPDKLVWHVTLFCARRLEHVHLCVRTPAVALQCITNPCHSPKTHPFYVKLCHYSLNHRKVVPRRVCGHIRKPCWQTTVFLAIYS